MCWTFSLFATIAMPTIERNVRVEICYVLCDATSFMLVTFVFVILIQGRLSEVEGENARLKSMLKQKDDEMEDIDKVAKRLQEERGKVADIIRQEFADR